MIAELPIGRGVGQIAGSADNRSLQLTPLENGGFAIADLSGSLVQWFDAGGRETRRLQLADIGTDEMGEDSIIFVHPSGRFLFYPKAEGYCLLRIKDGRETCQQVPEGMQFNFLSLPYKTGYYLYPADPGAKGEDDREVPTTWFRFDGGTMAITHLETPPPGVLHFRQHESKDTLQNGPAGFPGGLLTYEADPIILSKRKFIVGRSAEGGGYLLADLKGRVVGKTGMMRDTTIDAGNGAVWTLHSFKHHDWVVLRRQLGTASSGAAGLRPLYYDRDLKYADLLGRPLHELDLMRNWIYARVGNPFRKRWLHDYFAAQPWYHPLERMDESKLSDLDRRNARYIADYVVDLDDNELRSQAEALQAKAEAGKLTDDEKIEVRVLSVRLGKWYGADADQAEYKPNPLENPEELDRQLTVDDLADLSPRDLRLLRNTIYARRGKPFKSASLEAYFGSTPWYKPDPEFTEARLTPLDHRNAQVILSVERTLGGPQSEQEAAADMFALEGA